MRMYDIITKKKHGEELTDEEIREFVTEYTEGKIPDYQVSALMMAIYFRGMTDRETSTLTMAMSTSGDIVDLSEFGTLTVDKHSTGGVGDKTTLVVAPIAASLGCRLAKMSGRGLGHTGGTVDKLESFPGFDTSLTPEKFFAQVRSEGIAVVGQSGNLAPADKKLYALRDVTATVDSIPLITSSIMSKKLAAGSASIVLDVKCGSGAFMREPEDAETLATKMVEIGKRCGRNMAALITNMDIPLGYAIGNSLEVKEAYEVLSGRGPADLREVCVELASNMVSLSLGYTYEDAKSKVISAIESGLARDKFTSWIIAQGGDPTLAANPALLPESGIKHPVLATKAGYITKMNAEQIGIASVVLGAGRETKDSVIDHSAGIVLTKKLGDKVEIGDTLCYLHTNDEGAIAKAEADFLEAITISDSLVDAGKLIYKIVR
ncbi:MAG: pyrimidine-nucleoside phosphorylase [Clostridia bacterium]|nr:pyrimidine-nucleoside phosphorylase [Clostridia bacterium]